MECFGTKATRDVVVCFRGDSQTTSGSSNVEFSDEVEYIEEEYGLSAVTSEFDPDEEPEMIMTSSSERLLIPVFLRDYTEQQRENLSSEDYELVGKLRKDNLILTRGVVDKTRKVLFDPAKRLHQFWFQLIGAFLFGLYELSIILAQIYTKNLGYSITLQYIFYGAVSSIVMFPVVALAFYKCSWQYLTTHTSLSDWIVYSFQVFIPLPFGYRKKGYSRGRYFPWFTCLIIATWIVFYILTGPSGSKVNPLIRPLCSGNDITFSNLMANFMHTNAFHLLSNSLILAIYSLITEVAYGGWRSYLPVVIGLPFIQPLYGFCGYFGGSALWGLLAGSSVAVWFSTLHWKLNWDDHNNYANFARGFGLLWIMNVVQVLGDIVRGPDDTNIANWVHASAQFLGFFLGMVISPAFDRSILHAPGEFNSRDAKPEHPSIWYHWYKCVSLVGLIGAVGYIVPGFLYEIPKVVAN
uniref:Uncharacterized protein n=1 Tax=Timspurckia oligopyrenoides TaxID=708627 RepID=A0A7S0ZDG8_9RHOD|mmetsp:Transcript_13588/g.24366  ORF Transcript_13588/g.24366 Transcript_13588/m.24366 type:complete len:466 (+) Transcript_13588:170-1567(+)|eukprot:CAMPEP_0182441332 /NCGR_PEP_ID=MMETSP1172-20130603/260_1 /TAXON_ID=708627 /ORGANISM="Timspurckia oligopyrenoides, Strain CCMP3278" /LENGTH=465 /DNA_ID=CAMNT_0024635529 /DNA_START=129 /DNA_END=1526 /DNA_ORIENTATION=-